LARFLRLDSMALACGKLVENLLITGGKPTNKSKKSRLVVGSAWIYPPFVHKLSTSYPPKKG